MKRFSPIVLLMLFTITAQAQVDQWTLYATGFGTYSYQNHDESNYSNSQRSTLGNVAIGVFPAKNLMIGIGAGLIADNTKTKSVDEIVKIDSKYKAHSFTIGPLARYYIVKGLYGEASYLIGRSKLNQDALYNYYNGAPVIVNNQELKTKLRGFSAGVGYSIFLDRGKHLAIDVGVSYQRHKIEDLKYSGMAVGFGVSGFIFRGKEN